MKVFTGLRIRDNVTGIAGWSLARRLRLPGDYTYSGAGGSVPVADLTVSFADASDICRAPWRTESEAREQAAILDAAGWRVDHRFPPAPFGDSGVMIVANVYDPVTFSSPGDVTYRVSSTCGSNSGSYPDANEPGA